VADRLSTENLVKAYDHKKVVDDVSLRLHRREVVGLLGPNGAGKTTAFYMIVGLIQADAGAVFLDEVEITDEAMYLRARAGINYLPQEPSIFRKLTVAENLLAILETMNLNEQERTERLEGLLGELKIGHLRHQRASSLSGGERRRLEISRALVTEPAFILLDEPFAGIDPLAVIDIQNIVRELKERNIGVLISDHNVRETLGVCDRAYILNEGCILEEGSPQEVARSQVARKIYLGEKFSL